MPSWKQPYLRTLHADTTPLPTMLPDSQANSGDIISEGRPESKCESALLGPDVNLSSASFTVYSSSGSENESDAESSSKNQD